MTVPAPARKKSGRKALPSNLPRIEVIHDLPEADKRCAHDGSTLEVIGNEQAEQLDYVPAKLQVIRHIRLKYGCPCCHQGVKLAPAPIQLFPKSNATPALLAHPIIGCGCAPAAHRVGAWCCMTTMRRAVARFRSACSKALAGCY